MNEPEITSTAIDNAAIEKANMPGEWKPYLYQQGNGCIYVTGCSTRPKMSGKNKGEPLYLTKVNKLKLAITKDEVEKHKLILSHS